MLDLQNLPNAIPDEKLVYFLRRHPITLLSIVVGYALLLASPLLILAYFRIFQPDLLANTGFQTLLVFGGSGFFLLAWLFLFQLFLDYYLDSWIVTNRRILNIEQNGLFGRTVSELRLYRIQDVTATVNGFAKTMFNYGEVEIQTAGEHEHFMFEEIPKPNEIAKAILELSEVDRRDHLDEAVEEFGAPDKVAPKKKEGSAIKTLG
jgi:uncharacterized membrane protein YdbT with pleckstrin-like domain